MTTLEVTAYVDVEDVIRRLPLGLMPDAIHITPPQLWFGGNCYASAATMEELEALLLLYVQSKVAESGNEATRMLVSAPGGMPSPPTGGDSSGASGSLTQTDDEA